MKFILFSAVGLLLGVTLAVAEPGNLLSGHTKDLVVLKGDKLVPFEGGDFGNAEVTIVYFGAGWCPDCRKFSPKLVNVYKAQQARKRFEVLFVSRDKTAEGMLNYMKGEGMPWPALAFAKTAEAKDVTALYSGKGIPCLTILNRKGEVLKQSTSDQDAEELLQSVLETLKQQEASKEPR